MLVYLNQLMRKEHFKVSLVDHVDPRGNVPGWVVNMFKKKAGEAFLKLQQAYGSK
jgi:hypothetical protein